MELIEAKDKVAIDLGYQGWNEYYNDNYRKKASEEVHDKAALLFLEKNLAKFNANFEAYKKGEESRAKASGDKRVKEVLKLEQKKKKKDSEVLRVLKTEDKKLIDVFKVLSVKGETLVWEVGNKEPFIVGKTCVFD